MVRYLTGVSNAAVRAIARLEDIGLLVTPDTKYDAQVDDYPAWAADNGCFAHPETCGGKAYLRWLDSFTPEQRARALFATAPDVVGNAVETLARSAPAMPKIRALGYKVALVAQDGLEQLDVPWAEFDVLFIGGSTEWKLSPAARALTREAKARGKTVHMGRVNSYKRLKIADDFGVDTADGTFLKFGPTENLGRLLNWFTKLRAARSAERQAA
jgi:hypothetical protein